MALRIETDAEPIPGYRLLERLGAGGFGEVWKVQAPGGLLKALKIVRSDGRGDSENGALAQQELKALRRVQSVRHPYLLSIDRYDVIDDNLLIVTELADCNLWDRWRSCRQSGQAGIPRESLLRYLSEAAEVLDLMHTKHRLQHLDIKPQNLFLIHDHIKVADFGLVKDLHGIQGVITGGVTPFYAAPETFNDVVSVHCDQYSLAIVFQELLTGQRPFGGGSAQQVMVQHLQTAPVLTPLPASDRPIVARALSKEPTDRFESCSEFVRALMKSAADTAEPSDVAYSPAAHDTRPNASKETIRVGAPPRERRNEKLADGILVPALVIGLGGVGGAVLRRLRGAIAARFGELPHIQLLYVDTDADALATAQTGAARLDAAETLHVPLQRASYYLRPRRDGQRTTDGWLDSQLLGRMPRQPATQSVRALGRLAFVDHARTLEQAIAERVEAAEAALPEAAGATGMAARSDRPRVHIVAGLAGGTGSGMVLDIAYQAQQVLTRLGWTTADVQGWLLAPPVESGTPADVRATANTCAALIELRHFGMPETTYVPIGVEPIGLADTAELPFTALTVVPMAGMAIDGLGLAAGGLMRDLLSPLGQAAEVRRAEESASDEPVYRTLGAVRFAWPRDAILHRAAVRTSRSLVEQWLRAEPSKLRDSIQAWVADQWAKRELGPDHVLRQLQEACARTLGQPADALLKALAPAGDSPADLAELLARVDDLVGRAADGTSGATAGQLGSALLSAYHNVASDWSDRLSALALSVVDQPGFRLAGSEAAVRIAIESAERMLTHFGPLSDESLRKAAEMRSRLDELVANDSGRTTDMLNIVRNSPRWRFQGMLFGRVAAVYHAARVHLATLLEDLATCRHQLESTHQLFHRLDAANRSSDPPAEAAGWLLPHPCRTIDEAADRVVASLTWDDALALDRFIQETLVGDARGLAQHCLQGSDASKRLVRLLGTACSRFLAPRIDAAGAVEAFLGAYGGPESAAEVLASASDAAQPMLAGDALASLMVLEVPAGAAGAELAALARQRLGEELHVVVGSPDAIVVACEALGAPLAGLPHLGREALDSLDLVRRADGVAPHARFDVEEWVSPAPQMQ
jgi:hypothetical protein